MYRDFSERVGSQEGMSQSLSLSATSQVHRFLLCHWTYQDTADWQRLLFSPCFSLITSLLTIACGRKTVFFFPHSFQSNLSGDHNYNYHIICPEDAILIICVLFLEHSVIIII